DLLLLDGQLGHRLVDVEVEAPLEQKAPRLPAQLAPVDERTFGAIQEDVLADAERRDHHRALVHARDALLPRRAVARRRRRLAVQADGPGIRLEQTREDADERGLPGPVAADERVALARKNGDGDVLESLRPGERLPDRLRLRG